MASSNPDVRGVVSALYGGVIAFLSSLLTAFQGAGAGFGSITDGQWCTALLAFFIGLGVAGGATYQSGNRR